MQKAEVAQEAVQMWGPMENLGLEAFCLDLLIAAPLEVHPTPRVLAGVTHPLGHADLGLAVADGLASEIAAARALALAPDANTAPRDGVENLYAFHPQEGNCRTGHSDLTCLGCMQAATRPRADFLRCVDSRRPAE